jgi:hypothetical protein
MTDNTSSDCYDIDHSSCKNIAYLKHEDHIDFLHSCGSLFCNNTEVELGKGQQSHENLCPFKLHSQIQSNKSMMSNGSLQCTEEHSSCESVAFLPHEGHVDFLRSCGTISCRDDIYNSDHDNISYSHQSKKARFLSSSDYGCNTSESPCTHSGHDHSHGHHLHQSGPSVNVLESGEFINFSDHSNCKNIAYLRHDNHVDYLHSCGSLFCHDTEVILGEGQQKVDNLCVIDEDIISSFLDLCDDK